MPNTTPSRRKILSLALGAACMSSAAMAAERVDTRALASNGPVDSFIVAYRSGSQSSRDAALQKRGLTNAATALGRGAGLALARERQLGIGASLVRANKSLDAAEAAAVMRAIAANPDVAYVEPNIRLYAVGTPNDPQFASQYGFGTGAGGSNATQAWDSGHLGQGTIVAVIDTGITSHPDLNANVLSGGYDFVSSTSNNDGNGRDADPSDPGDYAGLLQCPLNPLPSNSSWHGTHVAGTVAAVTNNGVGVAGMAHQAKILPVRVLGRCGGSLADIIDAITWSSGGSVAGVPAVGAKQADVINMSLGGSGACSTAMQAAINGAVSRGTVVVVAAGNDNANVSGYTPAGCANTVVVGATDSAGAKASFSSYGAGVDVSAPGVGILSTLNAGTKAPAAPNYASYDGTSMAAPHVAGLAAMLQSKAAGLLSPADIETLLKATTKPFGAAPSQPLGTGIIDAKAAIDATP